MVAGSIASVWIAALLAQASAGQQVKSVQNVEGSGEQLVEKVNVPALGRLPTFSHATIAGDLVFVSGTLGTEGAAVGEVSGSVAQQTRQTLRNIGRILEAAGSRFDLVAKCTVYLTDLGTFAEMNEAWLEVFGGSPPARATVGVASLVLGAGVEIECIARRAAPHQAPAPQAAAALPAIRSGFFEHEGERLYYETAGEGEALVFTHGYGGNHAVWWGQVPAFADRYRVITWDQRGFGRSTNTAAVASPQSFARDLGALLDHLGIERAHLVGQSMGGWTVMGFAAAAPARVRSLVLADTPGGLLDDAARALLQRPLPAVLDLPLNRHPAIGAATSGREPARGYLYRQLGSFAPPPPADIPARLIATDHRAGAAAVRAPFLFVVGSDDGLFPPDLIRRSAAMVPGSRVVEIAGAGHSPYFEQPAAWNEAVLSFLATVDSNKTAGPIR